MFCCINVLKWKEKKNYACLMKTLLFFFLSKINVSGKWLFFIFIFYHLPAQKSWCFELWNLNHPCFRKETSWCFVFRKKPAALLLSERKIVMFEFWTLNYPCFRKEISWCFASRNLQHYRFRKENVMCWILKHHCFRKEQTWCFEFWNIIIFGKKNHDVLNSGARIILVFGKKHRGGLNCETSLISKRNNTEVSNIIGNVFFLRSYGWKSNYSTSSRKKIRIGNFPIGTLVCFFQLKSL